MMVEIDEVEKEVGLRRLEGLLYKKYGADRCLVGDDRVTVKGLCINSQRDRGPIQRQWELICKGRGSPSSDD
jgi:hypothetical protein